MGLVESYDYPDIIKNVKDWKVDKSTTDQINMTKLQGKRLDIAVSDIVNTSAVVKDAKLKVRFITPAIISDPLYVAFSATKPKLRDDFDAALGEMIKDGTADKIYQQDIGEKYTVLNRP